MRVLLYDQNLQRNKSLHRYLEDANIQVTAAYCLKDLLSKFKSPSLKVLLIEHSRIQHYNIDIEELLDRLGLTFTVIDYTETETTFDFTVHYLSEYYYFPFTTEKDKELIKKVKKKLRKYKKQKEKFVSQTEPQAINAYSANASSVNRIMEHFSKKQKQLITRLLEKKDGISVEEIIELLNAKTVKNSQNYAQTHIYRLRNKLNRLLGDEYIISYKDHTYQLLCIHK
ncbi:helix-turn-helix domain-containing protein [Treponema sp. OMZ 305]|uniref:helix-turn-helix domain-containing protein n=1 Tax=Treponema sp. OMZ 305 TaxID=1659192 RepID=UPI0020A2A554|nr:helix-turn-helix domain-containing protein [Treponema sp. OMZ 305]UTC58318.1 helix-turn-helix domain-containing protein [Treponema sp. OMZ 305]